MKTTPARRNDGGRQRCTGCGHPRLEHRLADSCSVPKCKCEGYAPRPVRMSAKDVAAAS